MNRRLPFLAFYFLLLLGLTPDSSVQSSTDDNFFSGYFDKYRLRYGAFPEHQRLSLLQETRHMFTTAYDCYMRCAFPQDELDPIQCLGRGPDLQHPENININDVLGDYSLTLVDSLSTLAVMGNATEFQRAVRKAVEYLDFDRGSTVQIFEATIRVVGGLLSAHLLMTEEDTRLKPDWYSGELLTLAHDLADRLLPSFASPTDLPHPRVNLVHGLPLKGVRETCTAGAGSLILEMGILSRLLNDPVYEALSRRAVERLWESRDNGTGLFGNVLNIESGEWTNRVSGLGAGIDSFYEYLLKSHIMFDSREDLLRFVESYEVIMDRMRHGREYCNEGLGLHPLYVNVDMTNGEVANYWIDSLQAAFPALQVLHGDVQEAICHHAVFYALWKKYDFLPERYNWRLNSPEVKFYPLRPELIESTYFLFRATKHPFYLHVGKDILRSLQTFAKSSCGYATIHNVEDKTLEDRQESFFLSETCKYLFLLFDFDNPLNKNAEKYLFSTEGHVFPISRRLVKDQLFGDNEKSDNASSDKRNHSNNNVVSLFCDNPGSNSAFELPLKSRYMEQLFGQIGVNI